MPSLYFSCFMSAALCFLTYLLFVHFLNWDNSCCLRKSQRKKPVIPVSALVAFLVSAAWVNAKGEPAESDLVMYILVVAGGGVMMGIIGGNIALSIARKEEADIKAQQKKAEEKKEEEYQSSVLRGDWVFPHREFYDLCQANNVPKPDGSEFSNIKLQKAVQLILDKHRIPPEIGKLHLSKGGEYYRMAQDEIHAAELQQAKNDSTLVRYTPTEDEKQMLDSIHRVRRLQGLAKREYMLRNQIEGLKAEESALRNSLIAPGEGPRFSYIKEKNWATWGGIADGLAGPAAGVMTALKVQQENERIREQNKVYMQANLTLDMMETKHRTTVRNKCSSLQEQQRKLENELETLQLKVVFDQPDSSKLAKKVKLSGASFRKTESGILTVSAKVSCQIPPEKKPIPNVNVDGSVHAKVYTEDRFVEDIYFILPSEGISTSGTSTQVHSLCTTALPVEGNYRLELGENSVLWMVEC